MKEDGYYWVKYLGEWDIARWTNGKFWLIGSQISRDKAAFGTIGPEITTPKQLQKEKKQ